MKPLLRAEFRKLLSIRSTYVLTTLALLLVGFIAFWVLGYKGTSESPMLLMDSVNTNGTAISIFAAIVAILMICHEYRYNTIMYTLTAASSRSAIVGAKILTIVTFSTVLTVVAIVLSVLLTWLGVVLRGGEIPTQTFYYVDTLWRIFYYNLGFALAGLLIGFLMRNVVGAIIFLLIVPTTVEGLLSLVLKDNARYLPFTAFEQVHTGAPLSPGRAAMLFTIYLVAGWLVAWYLFMRRDAN